MFRLGKNRDLGIQPQTPPDELSTAGRLARRENQITTVNELTWALLITQSGLHADDRDEQVVDVLLDVRRTLDLPAPIGSPLVRPAVPVVPGPGGEGGAR
jgi:hypothetical protein